MTTDVVRSCSLQAEGGAVFGTPYFTLYDVCTFHIPLVQLHYAPSFCSATLIIDTQLLPTNQETMQW